MGGGDYETGRRGVGYVYIYIWGMLIPFGGMIGVYDFVILFQ